MIHYFTTIGVGDAWVGNELREIQKAGIPFSLHALRKPPSTFFSSPEITALDEKTDYIYPISFISLMISLLSAPFLFKGFFVSALVNALFGERESFILRLKALWHLAVACYCARKLRKEKVSHIHLQWIHSSGTVGMYVAWLLNVSLSFTGHAADLFRERVALKDKIRRASFIVCISQFHRKFFLENGARPEQLIIVYCGINTSHFSPKSWRAPADKISILSSGRLVEKKGFSYLIDACRILSDEGFKFECIIAGSGPLEEKLREEIKIKNLNGKVQVTGKALLQEKIPEFMYKGDIYCLACVWAKDNDVDGLPQMLMEAMACGLPVISTRLVGIPDLVIDGETGLLVEPNSAIQLAEAIKKMSAEKGLSARIAVNGRKIVEDKFNLKICLMPLINEYQKRIN